MTAAPTVEIGLAVEDETPVEIPLLAILRGKGFLMGKTGSGKSNSANVIVEGILDAGRACMIIDVDGEYYGLKEEYELLHATGDDHGDIRVGPEHAGTLAQVALEQNVPVILDVSGFLSDDDANELVGKVARELFVREKKLKKPFLLVVEEAHEYIPQQGSAGLAGEHITRIAKRGRKHGLGLLGASQRPASVDKDVLTQAQLLIWHRLTYKNDTNVVKGMYGSERADAINNFADGEAIVDFGEWETPKRVQFHQQRTYDGGAGPGLDDAEQPELQAIGTEVIETLQDAGEAARSKQERIERLQEDLAAARDRIEELEAEVEDLEERNAFEDRAADALFGSLDDMDIEFDLDLGGDGSIRAEVMEVVEAKQELDDEVARLRDELADERSRREAAEADRDELAEYRDLFEEQEDLHRLRDDLHDLIYNRYSDLFDVGGDAGTQQLRKRVEALEAERQDLARENTRLRESASVEVSIPHEYEEFYEHETVAAAIDAAVADSNASERAVWGVILTIAQQGGPTTYDDVADHLGYGDNSQVSRAVTALEARAVLIVVQENPRKKVDFAFGEMEEVERKNRVRDEMERRIEQKTG